MSSLNPSPVDNVRWLLFKLLKGFATGTFGTTATAKYLPGPVDSCWTLTSKMLRGFSDGSFTGTANLKYAPAPGDNLTNLTRKLLQGFADGKFATGTAAAKKKSFAPGDDIWQIYRKLLQGFADGSFTNTAPVPAKMPSPADKDWDLLYKLEFGFSQGTFSVVGGCTPPNPATNLIDFLNTSSTIFFGWGQTLGGPATDHFIIRWGTSSGVYTNSDTVPGATFNYTMTGLTPNTTYFIVVQAVGTDGCLSANSVELSTTTQQDQGTVLANAWADRVVVNGGVRPSNATITAAAAFANGMISDGLDTLMISLNFIAPDNLIASITPFYKVAGNDPWTNVNFVSADLSLNGLSSAHTGYLKTGCNPTTCYLSDNDAGFTFYALTTGSQPIMRMNSFDGASMAGMYCDGANDQCGSYQAWNIAGNITAFPANVNFFFSHSRTASNAAAIYYANSVAGFNTLVTSAAAPGARPNLDLWAYCWNINGAPGQNLNAGNLTLASFIAIHHGLTSAQTQAFFNRAQTLRIALGGGFT